MACDHRSFPFDFRPFIIQMKGQTYDTHTQSVIGEQVHLQTGAIGSGFRSVCQSRSTSGEVEWRRAHPQTGPPLLTPLYMGGGGGNITNWFLCHVVQKITAYKGFIMASMSGHF